MTTTRRSEDEDNEDNNVRDSVPWTRKDDQAEDYPDDATSMSVPPPSGDARAASKAVGSPQANSGEEGPSPPNRNADKPASRTHSAARGAEGEQEDDIDPQHQYHVSKGREELHAGGRERGESRHRFHEPPSKESVSDHHPARDTLAIYRQDPEHEDDVDRRDRS